MSHFISFQLHMHMQLSQSSNALKRLLYYLIFLFPFLKIRYVSNHMASSDKWRSSLKILHCTWTFQCQLYWSVIFFLLLLALYSFWRSSFRSNTSGASYLPKQACPKDFSTRSQLQNTEMQVVLYIVHYRSVESIAKGCCSD